jgi:hypothetical protein
MIAWFLHPLHRAAPAAAPPHASMPVGDSQLCRYAWDRGPRVETHGDSTRV